MFSLCIGRLLIHRLTEYVAGALQLSSVPVDVQGQVALLVIPEGLCESQLINSLADLAETVVAVLHRITVTVYSPADLPGGGVFIAFLHPVHKANACDASPAVHVIGNGIPVAVHNSRDLPPGIILILLEGALMVPRTPDILDLSIQFVGKFCPVSKRILLDDRLIPQVVGKLLYHFT